MKSILFFISGCLGLSIAHAQTGTISGKLTDSLHSKEIGMATISVRKASDSSLVTYRLSNITGEFKVPGLPLQTPLRMVITYTGFMPIRKEFTLTKEQPVLDLGKIMLTVTTHQLEEVVITSEVPPVVMRHDTVEFNADAFKTLPEAALQDLLQKLPGVTIDEDGKLKANGKPVNKIMVEGRVFFGDDPKIAMQQLPANVIDKVQILDDTEQKEELNGRHLENLGKVINIKLKKNIKKGWFGKVHGGYGTDSRYEAGGIVNSFRDTLQVSVLGYSNNVNQAGFSAEDLRSLGGMDRGDNGYEGWGDYMRVGDANIGSNDWGIRKSTAAGLNVNYDLGKWLTLNGKYFLVTDNTHSSYISNSQQIIGDTLLNSKSTSSSVRSSTVHSLAFKVSGKKDSTWIYNYMPSFGFTKTSGASTSQTNTDNNFSGALTDQHSVHSSSQSGNSYSHAFNVVRKFKGDKRLALYQNFSTNSSVGKDTTHLLSDYYLLHQQTLLDQYKIRDDGSTTFSNNLTYSMPLSETTTGDIRINADYGNTRQVVKTYDKDSLSHKYNTILDSAYSSELYRKNWNNQVGMSIHQEIGKLNFTAGITWQSQHVNTNFGSRYAPVKQQLNYFVPDFGLDYKGLNLYYSKNISLPSAMDIQPLPNITNPLLITLGNSALQPTVTHSFSGYYFGNWGATNQHNINVYGSVSLANNAVISTRVVKADGTQVIRPVNMDGTWRTYFGGRVNLELYKNDKLSLRFNIGLSPSFSKKILSVNDIRAGEKIYEMSGSSGFSVNLHDVFELTPSYQLSITRSQFDNNFYTSQETVIHKVQVRTVLRMPKNFVWESAFTYRFNNSLGNGVDKQNFLLNTSFSYLFAKDHKAQIKLTIFDLLNQNTNLYRGVSENMIYDYQSTTLQRYGMLSFIYNIRGLKVKN